MNFLTRFTFLVLAFISASSMTILAQQDYTIKLASGHVTPKKIIQNSALSTSQVKQHILIQFNDVVSDDTRDNLATAGIDLLEYVPNFAYTARLNTPITQQVIQDNNIRWFASISAQQKLSPLLTDNSIPEAAILDDGTILFAIVLHSDEFVPDWTTRLKNDFGIRIIGTVEHSGIIEIATSKAAALQLAELDAVLWVEPGMTAPEEHNSGIRNITNVNTVQASPYNLSGNGVILSQWDGGRADVTHPDFGSRVISADGAEFSDHATHVAGTVLGSGLQSGGLRRGMAPQAHMFTQLWWFNSSDMSSDYDNVINLQGATISTNSWGFGVGNVNAANCSNTLGNYFSVNTTLDNIIRGSEGGTITVSWSAGNQRASFDPSQCGSIGWIYGTIAPPGTSKNVITVGATNSSNNSMTSFSSWGPTDDGRIKPDVVAAGCTITSTALGGGYNNKCGTSMSAPAIAGILALMTEEWITKVGSIQPLASTYKGIMINTAIDLGNPGPDYAYGHGAVDALAAVDKIGDGTSSYIEGVISTGESQAYDITIPSGADKLKVSLVWDDVGGTAIGGGTLINDIDLKIIDPTSNETFPWVLNPSNPGQFASRGTDHINNVETVEIDNPTPGLWKAIVSGFNIPSGPQKFSLIFTPDDSHTPGSLNAVAVFEGDDVSQLPGQTVNASFWVSNVGADLDSIQVQISDSLGWLQSLVDTTIIQQPFDSTFFEVTVLIPEATLAGTINSVICSALSLDDNVTSSIRAVTVTTNVLQNVSIITAQVEDTVNSPDIFSFDITVTNSGNAFDVITIRPQDDSGWNFLPAEEVLVMSAGEVAIVSFDALVPAEMPHLSVNNISTIATVSGISGVSDTVSFALVANNSILPPSLVSPGLSTYSNNKIYDFVWDGAGDSYDLFIARDTQFADIVHSYPGLTSTSFGMPEADSLSDGIYYWAVKLFVGSDSSSLQRIPGLLGVDNVNPGEIILLSPLGSEYLTNDMITLIYANDTGAPAAVAPEWYRIEYSSDSNFVMNTTIYDSITTLSFDLPTAQADGRWYWRAIHQDAAGNLSSFTSSASFVLDTEIPSIPVLLQPADNSFVVDSVVLFKWQGSPIASHETSPEYYFFHVSDRADFSEFDVFNDRIYNDSITLSTDILQGSKTFYWRVKAFDSAGFTSDYSPGSRFDLSEFICGDIDNSGAAPDIADLTFLISFLFINFDPPDIPASANVDCEGGIDIADLTALIDNLFINFTPLCCL